MAKDPAVLFYTSDFLTGTLTMNFEQKGKYITLLCLQHQKGMLTEKDMLSICNSYDEDVFKKFIKEGGYYYNERMKLEHDKRSSYSKSRSENRLKGLQTKKKKSKKSNLSYDEHMENENEDINDIKVKVRELVLISPKEHEKLRETFSENDCNWMYDKLNNYKLASGKKYKSDYGAINSWVKDELKKHRTINPVKITKEL